MIIIISQFFLRTIYQYNSNKQTVILPQSFKLNNKNVYTVEIKSKTINSFHVHICQKDILCNISSNTNTHVIKIINGTGEISGQIKKDGNYKIWVKPYQFYNDNYTIAILFSEPKSFSKVTKQTNFRFIIGITCLMCILYLTWIINWFIHFSMKNHFHSLLTIIYTFFLTEKFLHIFEYKSYYYQSNNHYKISIARKTFIGLEYYLFFLTNLLIGNGYSIYQIHPKIYFFFLSMIICAIIMVCSLFRNIYYVIITYFISFVSSLGIIALGKFYNNHASYEASKCKEYVIFTLFLFFNLYYLHYLVISSIYENEGSSSEKELTADLILFLFELIVIVINGYLLRMRNETKKDYKFDNFYSIYNVDTEYQTENENSSFYKMKDSIFSYSNVTNYVVSNNITSIGNNSFSNSDLKQIEFLSPSNLKKIGKYAFSGCSIKNITIPSSVQQIDEFAFAHCNILERVDFENNSNLTEIKNYTFSCSKIKSLHIPSKVSKLCENWCKNTQFLNIISIGNYNQFFIYYHNDFILGKIMINRKYYEILHFARRNIKIAKIPFYVKSIAPNSFEDCYHLHKIDFSPGSKLIAIESFSFSNSSLYSISIPSSVLKIGQYAFQNTRQMTNVVISNDSQLRIIDNYAFNSSGIQSINIPSSVSIIAENAFDQCKKLKRLTFSENSNLKKIEKQSFQNIALTSFSIPSSVIFIHNSAFNDVKKLKIVEIPENSQLCYFDTNLFSSSRSVLLYVPFKLVEILNI